MHHTGSLRFSAHGTPILFKNWLIRYKGLEFVESMALKSNSISKLMPFEKEELLEKLNEEIEQLQKVA